MIKIKIKKGRQSSGLKTDRLSYEIYIYDQNKNQERQTVFCPVANMAKSKLVSLLGINADTTMSALKNKRQVVL